MKLRKLVRWKRNSEKEVKQAVVKGEEGYVSTMKAVEKEREEDSVLDKNSGRKEKGWRVVM